jgi:hypothetical protein
MSRHWNGLITRLAPSGLRTDQQRLPHPKTRQCARSGEIGYRGLDIRTGTQYSTLRAIFHYVGFWADEGNRSRAVNESWAILGLGIRLTKGA